MSTRARQEARETSSRTLYWAVDRGLPAGAGAEPDGANCTGAGACAGCSAAARVAGAARTPGGRRGSRGGDAAPGAVAEVDAVAWPGSEFMMLTAGIEFDDGNSYFELTGPPGPAPAATAGAALAEGRPFSVSGRACPHVAE